MALSKLPRITRVVILKDEHRTGIIVHRGHTSHVYQPSDGLCEFMERALRPYITMGYGVVHIWRDFIQVLVRIEKQ